MNGARKFLRIPAVMERVGLKRTAIYARIAAGTFPKPIQLGGRAVAWAEDELVTWQENLERGVKKHPI